MKGRWKENDRKWKENSWKWKEMKGQWQENGWKWTDNEWKWKENPHMPFEYLTFILRKAVQSLIGKSQFFLSFWRSTSISCGMVQIWKKKRNFTSVFDVRRPFRAKRVEMDTSKSQFLPQFLTFDVHFVRKGHHKIWKSQFYLSFLTFDVHFVRKGCVSWRSGGPAPALERKKEEREGDIQWERERERRDLQTCKDVDLQMWDDVDLQM